MKVAAVALDVGQIPLRRAITPGPHVTAQLLVVTPQVGAVAVDVAQVGTDVAAPSIAVAIIAGRGDRRDESGAADCGSGGKRQNKFANHGTLLSHVSLAISAMAPSKSVRAEPPVCGEFMFDLSSLSFVHTDAA